mmetsp:Transcript_70476/g.187680  ORF Transcript_70476/g.187680 Transcript_70476/m.187680 type:complete len:287 (+) Transcript_70476:2887-3747(+)
MCTAACGKGSPPGAARNSARETSAGIPHQRFHTARCASRTFPRAAPCPLLGLSCRTSNRRTLSDARRAWRAPPSPGHAGAPDTPPSSRCNPPNGTRSDPGAASGPWPCTDSGNPRPGSRRPPASWLRHRRAAIEPPSPCAPFSPGSATPTSSARPRRSSSSAPPPTHPRHNTHWCSTSHSPPSPGSGAGPRSAPGSVPRHPRARAAPSWKSHPPAPAWPPRSASPEWTADLALSSAQPMSVESPGEQRWPRRTRAATQCHTPSPDPVTAPAEAQLRQRPRGRPLQQ